MKTIGYLTIGYPDLETSLRMAEAYVEGGCDGIEIGMPTENPFMEGKNIADKMKAAIALNADFDQYFSALEDFAQRYPQVQIFPIFYKELFLRLGYERIIAFCEKCGITKVLSIDLDQESVKEKLAEHGIYFVCCLTEFQKLRCDMPEIRPAYYKSDNRPKQIMLTEQV